jgi:hypothetical protein
VPGTNEICCTLISHFGDLNGPIALIDIDRGRFNPGAIKSITPEVPWPGLWPDRECFRDPVPVSRDYFLCSHAPLRPHFGIYVIDRHGNRELIYADPDISSVCPTPFRPVERLPVLADETDPEKSYGEFFVSDVYAGISPPVKRGRVKYIRVVEEVRHQIEKLPDGSYRSDYDNPLDGYASPVYKMTRGPFGWPAYGAKAPLGIVPVEEDGSACFYAPAGKVLYFQVLDGEFNELQRMRSVVQLQGGEKRSCVGCHEDRRTVPRNTRRPAARKPRHLQIPDWGGVPFSYERIVQPVLDRRCVCCHDSNHAKGLDFSGTVNAEKVPASYNTITSRGIVHFVDCRFNPGGCEKIEPLSFGTVKSRLWEVLDGGHNGVELTEDEMRRIKTWTDLNCPLWGNYVERSKRGGSHLNY